MITIYGIANCDTMKKARQWLTDHGVDYEFHDYKKQGVNPVLLREWVAELGWEALVNRKGTTWRKLPENTRDTMDEVLAIAVMEDQPSIIKRPILDTGKERVLGFDVERYQRLFLH